MVSDCGREGSLCAMLVLWASLYGLRPFAGLQLGLLSLLALLTRLLWQALVAMASLWDPCWICVWSFSPELLEWGTFSPLLCCGTDLLGRSGG